MLALLLGALLAQAQPAAEPGGALARRIVAAEAQGPMAPEAQQRLQAFRDTVGAVRARHAAEGPAPTLAAELRRRVELEQLARTNLSVLASEHHRLPDRERVDLHLTADMVAVDADNTAWLRTVLPADGWFRKSRDGEAVVRDAWILLIHSADDAFVDQVLARMEPLARQGEIDAASFAMRYDRVQVLKGRPQRYGMGSGCIDGYKDYYPIEDRAGVDVRRKALGLKPLAATAKQNNIGVWCGGAAAKARP